MLHGKTVVITGANGALGRAACVVAAEHGADVVALDLRFDGQPGARRYTIDLTDAQATIACFAAIGPLDVLFNIAGGFAMGPTAHATTAAQWTHMSRINFDTARNAIEASVPAMLGRGRGSIVNVGALSAREGQPHMAAYCVAKSAVMRLTESLAKELRGAGINVNAVLPSLIDTPTNRADMPDADFSRWLAPRDLAQVMCFLGSDSARAVHGALLPVTGLV
jgi:NAD(P)-dependent dehydrogenase (short-subunit alcohol dehydrogenase family)